MDLPTAIRIMRKELVIKDQPLKAYNLLKAVNLPELEPELKRSYGMVRHYFEPTEHVKAYDCPVPDAHLIEPEECIYDPGQRYPRYGWVCEEAKLNNIKSFLDLGCYVGTLPIYMAKNGIKATGVDLTSGSLAVAKSRADKFGVDVEFIQHDVTTFKQGTYDMVVSFEVFEHVLDPQAYIHHLASLTNPGGWIYITTPNGPFGNGEGNRTMKGGWEWHEGDGCRGHLWVFNLKLMEGLLTGYEIGRLTAEPGGLMWVKYRKPYEPKA